MTDIERKLFDYTVDEVERVISTLNKHKEGIEDKIKALKVELNTTERCGKFWKKMLSLKTEANDLDPMQMISILAKEVRD